MALQRQLVLKRQSICKPLKIKPGPSKCKRHPGRERRCGERQAPLAPMRYLQRVSGAITTRCSSVTSPSLSGWNRASVPAAAAAACRLPAAAAAAQRTGRRCGWGRAACGRRCGWTAIWAARWAAIMTGLGAGSGGCASGEKPLQADRRLSLLRGSKIRIWSEMKREINSWTPACRGSGLTSAARRPLCCGASCRVVQAAGSEINGLPAECEPDVVKVIATVQISFKYQLPAAPTAPAARQPRSPLVQRLRRGSRRNLLGSQFRWQRFRKQNICVEQKDRY